ncbi:hypothetical protein JVT61DRAFT_7549 [Boletus reticuloceps]|uniref:Uncharacterized protein n=1 Tax=Boletus reticuloceps TaxID=495285 RepID=A0A8I2YIS0_9AGAM|nr:hypothetical protein JVT61DRAFT_7549 [Boletus reticuloceps]
MCELCSVHAICRSLTAPVYSLGAPNAGTQSAPPNIDYGGTSSKGPSGFWTVEYCQPYFDGDTSTVLKRCYTTLLPFSPTSPLAVTHTALSGSLRHSFLRSSSPLHSPLASSNTSRCSDLLSEH